MTIYTVQTRNWNATKEGVELLDILSKLPGMQVFRNASNDNDDKYQFTTTSKKAALKVKEMFEKSQPITGGAIYFDEELGE